MTLNSSASITVSFSLPVRLLAPHPATGQDTLTVSRGPIIYTAESFDNPSIDEAYPHFAGIGMSESTTFSEESMEIDGIPMIAVSSKENVYALNEVQTKEAWRVVGKDNGARSWKRLEDGLRFVPFFARANRGGAARLRTALLRVGDAEA